AEAPHGGRGASGWGRTHGRAGLLEMVQMKYIDVDRLPRSQKPWWYRYGTELERAADAFLQFEFSGGGVARLSHARSALKTFFRDHGFSKGSAARRDSDVGQQQDSQAEAAPRR